MLKINELFSLEKSLAGEYLTDLDFPWEIIPEIEKIIFSLGERLDKNEYRNTAGGIWIHRSARISSTAYIGSPCIIGRDTEVRHCAFIRSAALIGEGCVVGNSTEIKNSILFDKVQVPHFNYIGDSVLGYHAHFGAGAVTSNVKSDRSLIRVRGEGFSLETKLRKLGALVGDKAEIGCGCVLNPGSVIGRGSTVYPLSSVRGELLSNSIYKNSAEIISKERKNG